MEETAAAIVPRAVLRQKQQVCMRVHDIFARSSCRQL